MKMRKSSFLIRSAFIAMMTLFLLSCKYKEENNMEGFIEVTGGKVWYKIYGADKKKVPLLILHGGPGASHDYLEPLSALADERPVIFYDQLGCGNSDRPDNDSLWTVERFVEELKLVRSALKLERVHLLGQSWGTMLAVEYLLREKPTGVLSLTLSAPYLNTKLWIEDQKEWISQLPDSVRNTIEKCEESADYSSSAYQEAIQDFYNLHVCRLDPWPECLLISMEKMGIEVYTFMWGPSEFTMNGSLGNADVTDRLSELTVPVLFTCGEFDEATPQTTAFYQSLLPDSELHVFAGASHEHHLEKSVEYNILLRNFIRKAE